MSIGKQQNTAGLRRFCAAVFYGGAGKITGPDTGLRCGGLRSEIRSGEGKRTARKRGRNRIREGRQGAGNAGDFIDRKPLSC